MRAALITGAAKRLGAEMAKHLINEGWSVGIHYNRSKGEAEKIGRLARDKGLEARTYAYDLSEPDAPEALVDQFLADFPGAYLLINNAAIFHRDTIKNFSKKLFYDHILLNTLVPTLLIQRFAEKKTDDICVINMLDQKVENITPDYFSYTVSKLALHNITRMTAMALWPHCRVNGIAPGLTLRSGDQTEEEFEKAFTRTPLGVGPTVEEICQAVSLIANTSSITNQIIVLDGGRHMLTKFPFDDLPKE